MYPKLKASLTVFIFFLLQFGIYGQTNPCLNLVTPEQGVFHTSDSCVIEVTNSCTPILKVSFQARYFEESTDTPVIKTIASVSKAPFRFKWDISKIPNQVLTGVGILAEVTYPNGAREVLRKEGLFFNNQQLVYPSSNSSYSLPGNNKEIGDTIYQTDAKPSVSTVTRSYWNEKALTFIIDVKDPLFYSNLPLETLKSLGTEILIDTSISRNPFPDRRHFLFSIPLAGKPYQVHYSPRFDEAGTFQITTQSTICDFHYNVEKRDFEGYKITFSIPRYLFGLEIPQEMSINFVTKTLDKNMMITRHAWVGANQYDMYSPFVWGILKLSPKPLLKNSFILWALFTLMGTVAAVFAGSFLSSLKRPKTLFHLEKIENATAQFADISKTIDRNIISKNIGLNDISKQIELSPKQINSLIRKHAHLTFKDYVMYCRTEIARERLRSTHSKETDIAESCGFKNLDEMEKYFQKFHKISPYRFRTEQQVA